MILMYAAVGLLGEAGNSWDTLQCRMLSFHFQFYWTCHEEFGKGFRLVSLFNKCLKNLFYILAFRRENYFSTELGSAKLRVEGQHQIKTGDTSSYQMTKTKGTDLHMTPVIIWSVPQQWHKQSKQRGLFNVECSPSKTNYWKFVQLRRGSTEKTRQYIPQKRFNNLVHR